MWIRDLIIVSQYGILSFTSGDIDQVTNYGFQLISKFYVWHYNEEMSVVHPLIIT